ncbi:hypothetical protein BVI1335_530108 [Burkholderia vietnamiensis]|nr:hypothetical protein BVI1335_530108 [Burkholderia vietnamiensis]
MRLSRGADDEAIELHATRRHRRPTGASHADADAAGRADHRRVAAVLRVRRDAARGSGRRKRGAQARERSIGGGRPAARCDARIAYPRGARGRARPRVRRHRCPGPRPRGRVDGQRAGRAAACGGDPRRA